MLDILQCPGYILASKISARFWSAIWGSVIFPCSGYIFTLKISVKFWLVIVGGVSHLSISRLHLSFRNFSEILVSNGRSVIFPCPGYTLTSKRSVRFLSVIVGDVRHLSMSSLYLCFKNFSEILVGNSWGQTSIHVKAIS